MEMMKAGCSEVNLNFESLSKILQFLEFNIFFIFYNL